MATTTPRSVAVLIDILEMTADDVDALSVDPLWSVRLAAAPTVPASAGSSRTGCTGRTVRHHHRARRCCSPDRTASPTSSTPPSGPRRDPRRTHPSPRRARPLRSQDRPRDGHRRRPRLRCLMSTARPGPRHRRMIGAAGDSVCRHRPRPQRRLTRATHERGTTVPTPLASLPTSRCVPAQCTTARH